MLLWGGGQKCRSAANSSRRLPFEVMVKSSKNWISGNLLQILRVSVDSHFRWVWNALADSLMRSQTIEVRDIGADDARQMSLAHNDHAIQAFAPNAANKPRTDRVGFQRTHRSLENQNLSDENPMFLAIYMSSIP
jgi:hypothetical protein